MKKSEVLSLLKSHTNERGLEHWKKLGADTGGLQSFGLGLTQLRKIAKEIGKDHQLAQQLWNTKNHDAKIISLLIDDPKLMTREQVEDQVEHIGPGYLAHAFSSCGATLAKSSFAFDLMKDWLQSDHVLRLSCGYGLLYELSKNKKLPQLSDSYLLSCIDEILATIDSVRPHIKAGMGGALIGIGKRNLVLNKAAVKAAKQIGLIDFNEGDETCDPMDVLKHLQNPTLLKKLKAQK